jgi:hypothetical protein
MQHMATDLPQGHAGGDRSQPARELECPGHGRIEMRGMEQEELHGVVNRVAQRRFANRTMMILLIADGAEDKRRHEARGKQP